MGRGRRSRRLPAHQGFGALKVIDASAYVEVLRDTALGQRIEEQTRADEMHAPAHLDSEVLSALGRLSRASALPEGRVDQALARLAAAPIQRHGLPGLLAGAWARRHNVSLRDALYVELASQLGARLVTTDVRLAAETPLAELIG